MSQSGEGVQSLLFPSHLLPRQLNRFPVVQLTIGKFLRVPNAFPVTGAETDSEAVAPVAKKGRPAKGEARPRKKVTGRFGGQGARSCDRQMLLLQTDLKEPCIPRQTFANMVRETVATMQGPDGGRIRMTRGALEVLHTAVEARNLGLGSLFIPIDISSAQW